MGCCSKRTNLGRGLDRNLVATTSAADVAIRAHETVEREEGALFVALMGTCAMATDFNHVGLFPFNIWGYNHFTNNIGRFIGYAFGFTFLFVNFMSYVVVYNLL